MISKKLIESSIFQIKDFWQGVFVKKWGAKCYIISGLKIYKPVVNNNSFDKKRKLQTPSQTHDCDRYSRNGACVSKEISFKK